MIPLLVVRFSCSKCFMYNKFSAQCYHHMSHVMRKPAFCICENKDADQLLGNREADQRLCFRYIDSTIPLLSKSKVFKNLAIFCGCRAWFVWDLVGNPEDQFSLDEAHIIIISKHWWVLFHKSPHRHPLHSERF